MSASTTQGLELPFLQPGQALKVITHNEALQRLDAGLYLSCANMAAKDLPEPPIEGQVMIVSDTPNASLGDHAGKIGVYDQGRWIWFSPQAGWTIWDDVSQELRIFNGQNWVRPVSEDLPDNLPYIGLNTSAAPHQRLAVASETSLFTHDGNNHQITVNRAAPTDTASVVFQTNYTGTAELGLAGTDGLSIKTSPDGVNWSERLTTPNDYAGVRAPAFGSIRTGIANDSAIFIETPATGGIFALTIVSDGAYPTVSHSGLIAYDSGQSPTLVVLAKTNRIEVHGSEVLDGTISAVGNLGLSAVDGGIYVENRLNNERILSLTFMC